MSIWSRIGAALSALRQGEPLGSIFERLRTPPERRIGFTIAVIALGAKMAKADGRVTRDEVTAFREVFAIPDGEEAAAARVFNLARQDVAGYEEYARRIARMFGSGETGLCGRAEGAGIGGNGNSGGSSGPAGPPRGGVLCDLLEGLFHIAVADGHYHPGEDDFLARVARIFAVGEADFAAMRARFVPDARPDPYTVLGLPPGTDLQAARARWRELVRDSHPDRMIARGVPPEAVRLAERRLVAVNRAWEEIQAAHA